MYKKQNVGGNVSNKTYNCWKMAYLNKFVTDIRMPPPILTSSSRRPFLILV